MQYSTVPIAVWLTIIGCTIYNVHCRICGDTTISNETRHTSVAPTTNTLSVYLTVQCSGYLGETERLHEICKTKKSGTVCFKINS